MDSEHKEIFLDELELMKVSPRLMDDSQLNESIQTLNKTLNQTTSEDVNYLINSSINHDIYQGEQQQFNPPIESISSCFLLSHFSASSTSNNQPTLASIIPPSPTLSSSSSLSLSIDASNSSLINTQSLCNFQQHFSQEYTNNFAFWNNGFPNSTFVNSNSYACAGSKHDASVGTELSFTKDLRSKGIIIDLN